MKWFDRIAGAIYKESPRSALVVNNLGQAVHPDRNYENFAKEGYQKNVVAYRCVNVIAEAVSDIPLVLYEQKGRTRKKEILEHPVFDLLDRPNALQTKQTFIRAAISNILISGNSFIYGIEGLEKAMVEMWPLRSDRMSINPGSKGLPKSYTYKVGANKTTYKVDETTGKSPVVHMKTWHPRNDWYGLSPIEAASLSIDQFNASAQWNYSLMKNSGRPSGAFIMQSTKANPKATFSPDQRAHLKRQIHEQNAGMTQAGKLLLLEGGVDYKELGFSPKDMDWINSKKVTSVDIALAFGVPGQLVGVSENQTYNNMREARLGLYVETVIPWMRFIVGYLNNWLLPLYLEDDSKTRLSFDIDMDKIEALAPMREKVWENAMNSTWLTVNEKREMTGYGKYEPSEDPADKILVGAGQIPLELAAESFSPDDTEEEEIDASDFQDEDIDETQDNIDPPEDDEEKSRPTNKAFTILEGKTFNLGSNGAKQRYAILQDRRRSRLEKTFEVEMRLAFKKQMREVQEVVKQADIQTVDLVVEEVISVTESEMKKTIEKHIRKAMRTFGQDVLELRKFTKNKLETKNAEDIFEEALEYYIRTAAGRRIKNISRTTKKRLLKDIQAFTTDHFSEGGFNLDELAGVIEQSYEKFTKSRSLTIARTETHNASQYASREAAKALKEPQMQKEWISRIDGRSRGAGPNDSTNHIAMNGKRVDIDRQFEVPSKDGIDMMDGPGDPNAPVDQIINCRCVTAYFIPEIEEEQ